MKDQKMHFKCFVERSMRKTKFSQMARTTFLMFRQGMKPRCLSCGQTLKIFIVKTSPIDITTSETLKLTVRLRIWTGNRLDVSTTGKEKAKGWEKACCNGVNWLQDYFEQEFSASFTKMYSYNLWSPRVVCCLGFIQHLFTDLFILCSLFPVIRNDLLCIKWSHM